MGIVAMTAMAVMIFVVVGLGTTLAYLGDKGQLKRTGKQREAPAAVSQVELREAQAAHRADDAA